MTSVATHRRGSGWRAVVPGLAAACALWNATPVQAQPDGATGPAEAIAIRQREKATQLQPHVPGRVERILDRVEGALLGERPSAWHPFFDNAYQGGGLTLGAGHRSSVGRHGLLDARGSLTVRGYVRAEVEYVTPLPGPRTELLALAGWRRATQVGFFGLGTSATSEDDRVSYGFEQPYAQVQIGARPVAPLRVAAGLEYSHWTVVSGSGDAPSIEEAYGPQDLPGLGTSPAYLQPFVQVGLDTRREDGQARAGTLVMTRASAHHTRDGALSFRRMVYEAVHHQPVLQDLWVLSLRTRVETTHPATGDAVPFFLLPSLGGGDTLRGFTSWRFRDRHSLLLSAEWRVMVNRFIEVAAFGDAGKVVSETRRLDLQELESDFGLGVRLHGVRSTFLRVDLARSHEGLMVVFAAGVPF
ncbi:hypothetical protein TBR22_A03630 [Luteitalea sp. TBR-22]|uniref:BamA/TamA family outer membrane protein n=1 Tax=Luteitalea sp. TBR-22 TaxID=2802971 RepID=UPI001AFCB1B7|nr:BamA/TamA family outer membrane protein [Luteitalea sp. TBR-22]BCS31163.1 hypothetical protein TBR22_A03630 [Luteitalea sp. TBR-22]